MSPRKTDSSLASLWMIFIRLLEMQGIDPYPLLREVGIDPEIIHQPNARLPSGLIDLFFTQAAGVFVDPAFGLRAAHCWHPSNLGVLGYAWLSSRTLRRGLMRTERYLRILGERSTCRCVDSAEGLRFIYNAGRGEAAVGHFLVDFMLSVTLDICRKNVGQPLNPTIVYLSRPTPVNPQPYLDYFKCEVVFGASEDTFVLATADADALLPSANPELADTFDAILAEQFVQMNKADIISRCKTFLLNHLISGEPFVDDLVKALGMSRRTLQRKLLALGSSYQQILEETRYTLAQRYLDDLSKSITEITFLLGFSEQAAFTRAFKRWSGMAPTDYRMARLA